MGRSGLWAGLVECCAWPAVAQEVRLEPGLLEARIELNGEVIVIGRTQDPDARLSGEFTRTARACPPDCINPMEAAPGVKTVGELELIEFLETQVAAGEGLLIDSRVPAWFDKGTIPGAVNVPFATLEPSNPYRTDILIALGAREMADGLDFADALDVLLFCNGPWCGQTPRAIRNMIEAGYPAEKIKYYRGGMQLWELMGLTKVTPQSQG
ncbi:MAG: rhodanese-like domain-containing protein [Pseudomonadota bacterium]